MVCNYVLSVEFSFSWSCLILEVATLPRRIGPCDDLDNLHVKVPFWFLFFLYGDFENVGLVLVLIL